jgi:hypothetical protein
LVKPAHVGQEGAVSVVWVEFLVPGWGILSTLAERVVLPVREATEAGEPVRQPYARVDYIPHSGIKNLALRSCCQQCRQELTSLGTEEGEGLAIIIGLVIELRNLL